eukprot:CAMPEP_0194285634 /NCGR_PEP_ID=MMETSP0169-20130528/30668_1 /TAXON_ID=218684 /ORGANISM="Corethron pennatum, Strain L29A3" /LENGTH=168 /DNA_ID=CAMNT_0039031813 /DNA_START=155 /DNA_END=658 /DNA_ORIENTATION=-
MAAAATAGVAPSSDAPPQSSGAPTSTPTHSPAPPIRFEDLTIDDALSPLQRLTKYAASSIALQRLVHVRTLGEVAAAAGYADTSREIMPLLPALAVDAEGIIRQTLALQLRPLADALLGAEAGDGARPSPERGPGYAMVSNVILAFLHTLLGDALPEVRTAAGSTLVA